MPKLQNRYKAQRSTAVSTALSRRPSALPSSRQSDKEDAGILVPLIKNSLFGLLGFAVSGILLVTLMCVIAFLSPDPGALVTPLAIAALMIASFIGGFIDAKLTRESPLLCGIVCGAMCAVLMLVLSLCFVGVPSSHYTFWSGLLMHAFALLFSILGAFTGNIKRKVNPKKRRFGN